MRVGKAQLHIVASILLATALATIAWGLHAQVPAAWQAGLATLAAAMMTAFLTRFVPEHAD